MIRLKLLAISFLMLIGLGAHAQTMAVESFELAQTDLTANTPGTMVHDQNGNLCALIKIETTVDGFKFDVGVLGVADVKRVAGEIWLYVPFGIKKSPSAILSCAYSGITSCRVRSTRAAHIS